MSTGQRAGVSWIALFVLAAALLVAPWFGHFDDTDAQLYQVVIRKLAERRAWLDPAYLDHYAPHFREHLPFGLWPYALARIGFGEHGPRVVAALFSLLTLAGIAAAGRNLLGQWPAMLAVLILATTDTFFHYGAATRLDPLLVLLANAAAVPALLGTKRTGPWVLACACAAAAALVKGPFGLVPLVAVSAARAIVDRSPAQLVRGGLVALVAALPLAGFLLLDEAILHAGWWERYGRGQLLASARGTRADGALQWWYPFATVAGRFWPGMAALGAVAVAALARPAAVRREVKLLALACLFMLLELCLPGRKVWNHALVAYPALALLGGAAVLPATAWLDRRARSISFALAGLALIAVAGAGVLGKAIDGEPCVGAREFAGELDGLRQGESVLVVSAPTSWRTLASLAAERRLEPDPVAALPLPAGEPASLALVQEGLLTSVPGGWSVEGRARGWVLLRREPGPR